jgi:putative peptidoglycan lipid II flippase
VSLGALAINLALKILLYKPMGASGLALATAINAWINFFALLVIGLRRYLFQPDDLLKSMALAAATAGVILANVALWLEPPFASLAARYGVLGSLAALALFGLVGLAVYGGALFGGCKVLGIDLAQLGISRLLRRKAAR